MTILSAGLILVTIHRGTGKGHRGYVIFEKPFSTLSLAVYIHWGNCCVKPDLMCRREGIMLTTDF